MDELTLKKHRLLLDLLALEAEVSRIIMLNTEPPLILENQEVSQGLVAAHELVKGLIAKLQRQVGLLLQRVNKKPLVIGYDWFYQEIKAAIERHWRSAGSLNLGVRVGASHQKSSSRRSLRLSIVA